MAHKGIFILLIGVLLTSSLFKLTESPSVWYDEGFYIQTARNVASSHWYGLRLGPDESLSGQYMSVGFPLIYPLAGAFKLFGYGILQARAVMVLFILGFALAGFALMRKLYGVTTALWALALLAVFPPLYANGKSVLGEVPGLLYLTLALLSFYYVRTSTAKRLHFAVLAGVFVGITCVTKPVFLLLLPAIALSFVFKQQEFLDLIRDTRIVLWSSVAFFAPIFMWMLTQFSHTDSLLTTLKFYMNPYAIAETNLAYMMLTNFKNLFTDVGPLFLVGMISVWTVSIFIRKRDTESVSLEECIAYIFSVISIIAYLRTGGFYRYLFPYQAIALLFFPFAFQRVAAYLRTSLRLSVPIFSKIPTLVFILLIALSGYQLLFNSWVAEFYTSTKTSAWEAFFAGVPSESSIFFYNTPEVAVFMHTERYYQYITPYREPIDVKWGARQLSVLDDGIPDSVIIETRRLESAQAHLNRYVPSSTLYKYTILSRLKK